MKNYLTNVLGLKSDLLDLLGETEKIMKTESDTSKRLYKIEQVVEITASKITSAIKQKAEGNQ